MAARTRKVKAQTSVLGELQQRLAKLNPEAGPTHVTIPIADWLVLSTHLNNALAVGELLAAHLANLATTVGQAYNELMMLQVEASKFAPPTPETQDAVPEEAPLEARRVRQTPRKAATSRSSD